MNVEHEFWDELLAGHALHALDPDDERQLERHAADCDTCREHLMAFEAVAADLGRAVPSVPLPPDGKTRLRAALAGVDRSRPAPVIAPARTPAGTGGPPSRSDATRPGDRRFRRPARVLLGAMTVVVLLAGAAVGYGVHQRQVASRRSSQLATAEQLLRGIAGGDRTVAMQSNGKARGEVVQSDGHVWLVADGLTPNDQSSSIYVLWATTPQGGMAAVATFDVRRDGFAMVNRVALPTQAATVPAFAVSHESGRTPPPRPSTPLLRSEA